MKSLAEILGVAGSATERDRDVARRALRSSWCWPIDGPSVFAARRLAGDRPSARVGSVPLVSVEPATGRASFWEAVPAPWPGRPDRNAVSFLEATVHLTGRLVPLVTAATPTLQPQRLGRLGELRWRCARLGKSGPGIDSSLDGESFGLALGLGLASWLADLEPCEPLLPCASVTPEGGLEPVAHLQQKLALAAGWGLGLVGVLVAQGQEQEARAIVEALDWPVDVRGCATLAEGIEEALPSAARQAEALDPEELDWVADGLFQAVLAPPAGLRSWAALATSASAVEARTDGMAAVRARFALQVARRHDRAPTEVLEVPEELWQALPRSLRLQARAHQLQHANDLAEPGLLERARGARELLHRRVRAREAADLVLLGAIGRALAAEHAWQEATEALEGAVEGWRRRRDWRSASIPLCELLRIDGILGAVDRIDQRVLLTETAGGSSYLRLALGRALVQADRPRRALEALLGPVAEGDWEAAPAHVRIGRARWLARACDAVGEPDRAGAWRARALEVPEAADPLRELGLLVELDGDVAAGGTGAPSLAALRERARGEVARLERHVGSGPREIADHWRY